MGKNIQLPENAYTPLSPGEKYVPIENQEKGILEVTFYSVIFGFLMGIVFSGAAAYIALKLGQGIETAIPIAILAVGFSGIIGRKVTLIENVNVLAIGATSGIIVGGSVFTMPAIYILGIEHLSNFFQIFIIPFFGAVLGVLFLIPFRKYFVSDQHGKLPFPEATATTEVLVTGQQGGDNAKVLTYAMILGGVFDFVGASMRAWSENFTTAAVSAFSFFTDKVKAVFSLNTSAAVAGLGYLIGVRYAAIIFTGSMMSWFVLVPLFAYLGKHINVPIIPAKDLISTMGYEEIFRNYARYIGIGGIFTAGLISILKMSKVIVSAVKEAFGGISKAMSAKHEKSRLDEDINMSVVFTLMLVMAVIIFLYFRFIVLADIPNATMLALIAVVVTYIITFLFTSVSAWAIAMISVTPISGMTLMTLIITAIIFSALGLKGDHGMLATLLIGGVVCTALSMAGTLVTEFKVGYWLGSTPRIIQWGNIAGAALASITVTAVIMLLAKVYGFAPSALHATPLPAPQPNAMAAVLTSLMKTGGAPWFLYGMGAVFAIIVEMLGISGLAFALGMYIPIELNSPILAGAIVSWFVQHSSRNEKTAKQRNDRGILIASGLIAGGALIGVITALIRFLEDKFQKTFIPDLHNIGAFGNILGLVMFAALCFYIYWDAKRAKA